MNIPGFDKVPAHLRKPLLALVGIGVFTWLAVLGIALRKESPQDIAKRIQAEADARTAKQIAELKADTDRVKLQAAQKEQDNEKARLAKAEKDAVELAKKIEREAEQQLRKNQEEAEREKSVAEKEAARMARAEAIKIKNDALAKEKAEREQKKEAEAEAKADKYTSDQNSRLIYAADAFGAVKLDPDVTFSPQVKAIGASVEIKGESLAHLQKLYTEKDWLGLYRFTDKSNAKDLPQESLIGYAAKDIGEEPLNLILKTPYKRHDGDDQLLAFFIWKFEPGHLMFDSRFLWAGGVNAHPDGIGYVYQWQPKKHDVFFVIGDRRKVPDAYRAIQRSYREEIRRLEAKLRLTELTREAYLADASKLDEQTITKIRHWVQAGAQP